MAYTLGDPFRPLRLILRLNGIGIGLLLGLLFLLAPSAVMVGWGLVRDTTMWPLRLAGASQIALGCFLLIASGQDYMARGLLFTATLTHSLWAMIILVAYFQRELDQLIFSGRIVLVMIFFFCLVGAVTPLHYIRNTD